MPDDRNGKVYLVGAGPGDPGLLTLRARECLQRADLVLYDGLVNPLILQHTAGQCERTARVRRENALVVPQAEVCHRMIQAARAGRTVVRLKGGDPYIFGRGSEEVGALETAGVRFEVVPGITAASAAAEYAGFPLTHREVASAVAFITGHEDPMRTECRLDYRALAAFPGTLVFYMGLTRLSDICAELIAAGKPGDTPAAIVCQTTLPSQRSVFATLQSLPAQAAAAALRPPSLIIVGDCLRLRRQKSWFEELPLFGLSIGITRPRDQSLETAQLVARLGGEPVVLPLIEVAPVSGDAAENVRLCLLRLADYDWVIFTSVNAVTEFVNQLRIAGLDARALGAIRIAAIGTSTAEKLHQHLLTADVVPSNSSAESLSQTLIPRVSGQRCLYPRASRGREVLTPALRAAGAVVDELVVYENRDASALDPGLVSRLRNGELHWIGLSSPAIARQLAALITREQIPPESWPTRIASLSPVTSQAAADAGLIVAAEAGEATWEAMLAAIARSHNSAGRP